MTLPLGTEASTLPRTQRLVHFPPCGEVLGGEDSTTMASEQRALVTNWSSQLIHLGNR